MTTEHNGQGYVATGQKDPWEELRWPPSKISRGQAGHRLVLRLLKTQQRSALAHKN
jgi:hypothetical protein